MVLGFGCWAVADGLATKKYVCIGRPIECLVTEQTPFGSFLIFVGWVLIIVACLNLWRLLSGK